MTIEEMMIGDALCALVNLGHSFNVVLPTQLHFSLTEQDACYVDNNLLLRYIRDMLIFGKVKSASESLKTKYSHARSFIPSA